MILVKAFDTINHKILLQKLYKLHFSQSAVNFIKNYLSNRSQITKINEHFSEPKELTCGVPQGSILGPTLFLIYINDLHTSLTYLEPILYADDTNLFLESKNLNDLLPEINHDLQSLSKWCIRNKLTINLEKTSYVVLKNAQNKYQFKTDSLYLNGKVLTYSDNIKFLGIFIDKHLNWSCHIDNLTKDLRSISGFLFRVSKFLPQKILLLLYNSFVNSKLSYCIDSWGNACATNLSKVFILQKRIIRTINKKPFYYHTSTLFSKTNILTIQNLYKLKILVHAHHTFYSRKTPSHQHFTRISTSNIPIPLLKSTAGQRTRAYQESALWNSLPKKIKDIESIIHFRTAVKRHLLA